MMREIIRTALPLLVAALVASAEAWAGPIEQKITKSVEGMTGQPVEAVNTSSIPNLYEVITPGGIVYSDVTGQFVIVGGAIVDAKTKENLTEKRMAELSKFKWSELPFKDAIKIVRGNGSRMIATVEDPNCGYCKKFAPELHKLNDVTIYTFVVPILGPDSVRRAKAIWCSSDRQGAWNRQMNGAFQFEGEPKCDAPGSRLAEWSRKMRVFSTPTILFADGSRLRGMVPADVLEKRLKEIKVE